MKFIGSSKITYKKISMLKDVADLLKVKDGDHVLFYLDDEGNVVLKKG